MYALFSILVLATVDGTSDHWSFERIMQVGFTITIISSLTWAWWHSRRTPEEEAEIAMLDAGLDPESSRR